jgi:hypothetical protein
MPGRIAGFTPLGSYTHGRGDEGIQGPRISLILPFRLNNTLAILIAMPRKREISLYVDVKLSDLYDPFKPCWHNLWRWAAALVVFGITLDLSLSQYSLPLGRSIQAVLWAFAAFLMFMLVLFPHLRMWEAARQSDLFRENFYYVISPLGLHIEGASVRTDFKWSAFDRIDETESLFVFRRAPGSALYLPKRCIPVPEDLSTLRSLISTHFLGRCRLRSD